MRPSLDREVQISWGLLIGVVVVAGAVLAWWHDWGAGADEVVTEERRYRNRVGAMPYQRQLSILQERNQDLQRYLSDLQRQVGIREVPPFLMPPPAQKAGEYFTVVYNQIWSELQKQANRFSVASYDYPIGFAQLQGRPPQSREEVRYYLTMLQLVTKAVYLSLSTPDKTVQHLRVTGIDPDARRVTGPDGRPPLLLEYPFQLEIRASLKDILWLLHQLSDDQLDPEQRSAEQQQFAEWLARVTVELQDKADLQVAGDGAAGAGNEICPLIVHGLTITSGNLNVNDAITELEVVIDLAGMEFLTADERTNGVAAVRPERQAPVRERLTGTSAMPVARP